MYLSARVGTDLEISHTPPRSSFPLLTHTFAIIEAAVLANSVRAFVACQAEQIPNKAKDLT